jgi:hypothetical protein
MRRVLFPVSHYRRHKKDRHENNFDESQITLQVLHDCSSLGQHVARGSPI